MEKVEKSEQQWREQLGEERYQVLREGGTERAFAGALVDNHDDGMYRCAGCGAELFASDTKFESGSGWPSFTAPTDEGAVSEITDTSHGMRRVEVRCARCEGHLGHVFPDGPGPAGHRYCMNSAALEFEPASSSAPTRDPD